MIEKLKIRAIYDDFIRNVALTEEQIKILDMMINKETIVKMSMEIGVSERTIGYEVKKIKKLYEDYYQMQLFRMLMLIQ
jgi:transcriptional antiterminator